MDTVMQGGVYDGMLGVICAPDTANTTAMTHAAIHVLIFFHFLSAIGLPPLKYLSLTIL